MKSKQSTSQSVGRSARQPTAHQLLIQPSTHTVKLVASQPVSCSVILLVIQSASKPVIQFGSIRNISFSKTKTEPVLVAELI